MYTALLVLGFFLIGVPGSVYFVLQLIAAQKRAQLAYDWSVAEISRRTQRAAELEQAYGKDRATVGRLMKDITALNTQRAKLEAVIEQSQRHQ